MSASITAYVSPRLYVPAVFVWMYHYRSVYLVSVYKTSCVCLYQCFRLCMCVYVYPGMGSSGFACVSVYKCISSCKFASVRLIVLAQQSAWFFACPLLSMNTDLIPWSKGVLIQHWAAAIVDARLPNRLVLNRAPFQRAPDWVVTAGERGVAPPFPLSSIVRRYLISTQRRIVWTAILAGCMGGNDADDSGSNPLDYTHRTPAVLVKRSSR